MIDLPINLRKRKVHSPAPCALKKPPLGERHVVVLLQQIFLASSREMRQLRDTLYVLIRVQRTYLQVGLENASSHEWQFNQSRQHLRRYAAELWWIESHLVAERCGKEYIIYPSLLGTRCDCSERLLTWLIAHLQFVRLCKNEIWLI